MDFDFSIKNAATNEEYTDESMLLPRGTRLIVQRLPAAKGHGFLARMARNQYGGVPGPAGAAPASGPPSGFYEIDSRARDEDDEEFVTTGGGDDGDDDQDVKDLALLQAVTQNAISTSAAVRPTQANFNRTPGQGPPQHQHQHHGGGGGGGHGGPGQQRQPKQRANADPELRDQEKLAQPKKRATGIPRTFLSLSAARNTENTEGEGGENEGPQIQPNTMGFEQLKSRGGGQSENAAGSTKSLDYALKVTATTIPDYLQCALCQSVALTAMFLTWDPEGRTTCEKCIRDALAQNGFRDPLTGMEGISPDDLRPNPGIRKAAEAFVKGVMKQIEEIEQQQVEEEPRTETGTGTGSGNLIEGDSGVIVTKRNIMTKRGKAKEEEDPFGGDDDFGGDVFAVQADEKPEEEEEAAPEMKSSTKAEPKIPVVDSVAEKSVPAPTDEPKDTKDSDVPASNTSTNAKENTQGGGDSPQRDKRDMESSTTDRATTAPSRGLRRPDSDRPRHSNNRRDHNQNNRQQKRGPPAGYQMGPAGGAAGRGPPVGYQMGPAVGARDRSNSADYHSQDGRGSHPSPRGRGGGRFQDHDGGRGGGRFQDRDGGSYGRGRGGGRGRYGGRQQSRYDRGQGDRNGRDRSPSRYQAQGDRKGRDRSPSRHQAQGDRNGRDRSPSRDNVSFVASVPVMCVRCQSSPAGLIWFVWFNLICYGTARVLHINLLPAIGNTTFESGVEVSSRSTVPICRPQYLVPAQQIPEAGRMACGIGVES